MQLLKNEQDRAIKEVVADQISRGILPITTGEYERGIFYGNFFEALSGVEMRYTPMEDFKAGFPTNRPLIEWGVPGRDAGFPTAKKVTLEKSAYLEDWLFLRSLLPEERWKDAKVSHIQSILSATEALISATPWFTDRTANPLLEGH